VIISMLAKFRLVYSFKNWCKGTNWTKEFRTPSGAVTWIREFPKTFRSDLEVISFTRKVE